MTEVAEEDRRYYRSSSDGELGWLVEKNGVQYVKLNRPNEELLRPWANGSNWVPEVEHRPISQAQLALVCFEADKALCRSLGLHDPARKEWLSLSDRERIAWMEKGPKQNPIRAALWTAIHHVLDPLTR